MTADDGTDSRADPGRQRTVAELLAQHGGGKAGGSRRRRRAPDDDEEPASAVAQTGGTDLGATGRKPDARDTSATRSGRRAAPAAPADAQPSGTSGYPSSPPAPQVPAQRWPGATGFGQSIDPLTGEPIDTPPAQSFGAPPGNPGPAATGAYRSMPLTRTDPPTEELPLYPERSWASRAKDAGPMTGPITGPAARAGAAATGASAAAGPATGHVSRAELFDEADDDLDDEHDDDLDDEHDDELDDDELDDAGQAWGRRASAAPAGLAERGERGELLDEEDLEPDERPQGVMGWLGLLVQWVVGAVAGALLWVGFSYLWMHLPVVALIAAVLATAILVLVVRAIRRSDDLQTTMLAVLVGLVVTISPAVLLLAVR